MIVHLLDLAGVDVFAAHLALHSLGVPRDAAFAAGMLAVVALRLFAICWGPRLPGIGGQAP